MSNATLLCLRDLINLPNVTWYVTVATINKLKATANGWHYHACFKCPKVVKGEAPPYICVDGHSIEVEIYRYKIEIEVVDNGSSAIFIFWDRECNKLLEIFALQLLKTMIKVDIEIHLIFHWTLIS
ncbi:unnamed protein product [Lathyrus sativus]|nr:unnamed protein product [Lathyrus sativus]